MEHCPHCNADLRGAPIPEAYRSGTETHYSRKIGVEVWGQYDGVLFWQCPDCKGTWHRWSEGTWPRQQAEPYIHGPKYES